LHGTQTYVRILPASVCVVKVWRPGLEPETDPLRGSIGSLPKNPSPGGQGSNTAGADCYARRVAAERTEGENRTPGERGDAEERQVLGSLPRRRPAIETPRRASARAAAERTSGTASSESARESAQPEHSELEQLARAGARLAGGAAATGLKLAGRAVGGLGRVVGRR
jgi:hypothetical protein